MRSRYRLDVFYPVHEYSEERDAEVENLVGFECESCGVGSHRDMQFYFQSRQSRRQAADRLSVALPGVAVLVGVGDADAG